MINQNYKKKFKKLEEEFVNQQGLPFADILSIEEIEKALEKEKIKYRKRILTPMIIVWAFLSQIFNTGSSCRKATSRVLVFFYSQGIKLISLTESAYCQAKNKLKESLLKALAYDIGKSSSNSVPQKQRWKGHIVKVMDSTGILMEDTKKNQKKYPQYYNSRPGCGFPILRLAVLFCLCTGVVLEAYLEPVKISEREMFRRFYANFAPGDVILGDRGCCSFADVYMLQEINVDCVFRICARKKVNFEGGNTRRIRLGRKDHIIEWSKPNRPKTSSWTTEEYRAFPNHIWVREVQYEVDRPGFRTKKVTLVTTLLNAEFYPVCDLADLYYRRWEAEINLRHIKTTMKMEFIKAKTPEMVRKTIWGHFLIYNLIRRIMWDAAMFHNVSPRRISFKGTIDRIDVFLPQLSCALTSDGKNFIYQMFFWNIAKDILPIRKKDRIYKRCVKTKKHFPKMTQSRAEYRASILGRTS